MENRRVDIQNRERVKVSSNKKACGRRKKRRGDNKQGGGQEKKTRKMKKAMSDKVERTWREEEQNKNSIFKHTRYKTDRAQ